MEIWFGWKDGIGKCADLAKGSTINVITHTKCSTKYHYILIELTYRYSFKLTIFFTSHYWSPPPVIPTLANIQNLYPRSKLMARMNIPLMLYSTPEFIGGNYNTELNG
jgi:hypothetical protein